MKLMQPLLILVFLITALTGCGDLLGTKAVKKEMDTSRFRASCDLDLNAFSMILHEPITSQIKCLQSNINLFITIVENERPGYMSRKAFEAYLRTYRQDDISEDVINAIKAVYDVNYLLTGDDPEYISKASVDKLFNFVLIFNNEASRYFARTFQDESAVTYKIHEYQRSEVLKAALRIMDALRVVHQPDGVQTRSINILDLLRSFSTEQTRPDIEKIEDVLFAKKVLIGGDKETLTHKEIGLLIRSFPDLTVLALDAVRFKYIDLSQKTLISLIKKNIDSLNEIIFPKGVSRDHEKFFTIEEAKDVVKMFVKADTFDVEQYNNLIGKGKKILMGGSADEVSGADFKNLMTHLGTVLRTGETFHSMYETFLVPLESKLGPLVINFEQNQDIFYGRHEEFRRFIRIVKDYRFMGGEFESPYYSREWWRNPDAIFEIYLFEYLIEKVFAHKDYRWVKDEATGKEDWKLVDWGIANSRNSGNPNFSHHMDQFKFEALVKDFASDLVGMGLIAPGRATSISDTISLLGTLFQYQSSQLPENPPVLDVNEATEFAVSLMSGINMAKVVMKDFKQVCPDSDLPPDQEHRVSPECFKKNFFPILCDNYRRHYPLLFQDINGTKNCEEIVMNDYNSKFLQYSIEAARTCNYYHDGKGKPTTEEIYYSEGDIMTIIVEMMHIEATMIRWDKNRNNKWDPDEADLAYSVYSSALDGFLTDMPSFVKGLKKQIYFYLLKYEDVPPQEIKNFRSLTQMIKGGGRLAKLWLGIGKPGATRKTMAAVLRAIGNENAKMRLNNGDKLWDCNLLREPWNIPADYDPNKN